jgi:hypothetical protein
MTFEFIFFNDNMSYLAVIVNFHKYYELSLIGQWLNGRVSPSIYCCEYCLQTCVIKGCSYSNIDSFICQKCFVLYVAKQLNRTIVVNGESMKILATANYNATHACMKCSMRGYYVAWIVCAHDETLDKLCNTCLEAIH